MEEIAGAEVEIEFLTDGAARNNKDKNVLIAGVVAQSINRYKLVVFWFLSLDCLSLSNTLQIFNYFSII